MGGLCECFLIDLNCGYVVDKYELARFAVEKVGQVKNCVNVKIQFFGMQPTRRGRYETVVSNFSDRS